MFTFSEDYIIKSVLDMVKDESKRIASLGLATDDEIKEFTMPIMRKAFSESNGDKDTVLKSLAVLHENLRSIRLPGDFEVAAGTEEQELLRMFPSPEEKEGESPEETKKDDEEEAEAVEEPKGYEVVYSSLRDAAYKLASKGDHESAYTVERMISKLDEIMATGSKEEINDTVTKLKAVLAEPEQEQADEPRPFEESAPEEKQSGAPSIAVSGFAASRHTPENKYSHFSGTWDQLIQLVKQNFNRAKPGYREGVVLVPVPAEGFFTGITELKPGANISARYEARREGEDPYMQLTMQGGEKLPARSVDIVLYSHETLEESGEQNTGSDWEIVSVNASPWEGAEGESEPLMPEALMRNYFQEPGGSAMPDVTPEQFIQMLKKSRDYWRNKVMLG